jgi:hypothetical protein
MGIRIGALAAALALVFGASACGGDDDSSSSSGSTAAALSKDEFVTQANQICADGNKEIDAAGSELFSGGQPSKEEQDQFITETVLPSISDQVDQIEALGAPEGDEDQVNAIIESARSDLDAAEADPSILTGGGADPFADTNKLLNDYGLTTCAGS